MAVAASSEIGGDSRRTKEKLIPFALKRGMGLPKHLEFVEILEIERGLVTAGCRKRTDQPPLVKQY